MKQQQPGHLPLDDQCFVAGDLEDRFHRMDVLLQLDRVLTSAANRHSLAADLVHGRQAATVMRLVNEVRTD